jgi:hypothetical protein
MVNLIRPLALLRLGLGQMQLEPQPEAQMTVVPELAWPHFSCALESADPICWHLLLRQRRQALLPALI